MIPIGVDICGKHYTIKYTYNALSEMEVNARSGIANLFSDKGKVGLNTVRLLIWAGLMHNMPNWTMNDAGDLIEQYLTEGGNLEKLMDPFKDALKESQMFKARKNAITEEGE